MGVVLSLAMGFVTTLVGAMILRAIAGPKWAGAIVIGGHILRHAYELYLAQQAGMLTEKLPGALTHAAGAGAALSYTSMLLPGLAQLGVKMASS
jgi:hypothetical protein